MDLDNITDIEVLKKELKRYMVKIKVPIEGQSFKVGHWYRVDQDDYSVTIYNNTGGYSTMSYETAKKYLSCEGDNNE